MKSKSWLKGFARVFAISAAAAASLAAQAKSPVIALMDAADAPQWSEWVRQLGWRVVAPGGAAGANVDARVIALAGAVRKSLEDPGVDAARVYLAGRGQASAAVFYAASRAPDLWAAAVMVGGSPQEAVDTGRIFATNFSHVPVLWAGANADDPALASRLRQAGVQIDFRPAANLSGAELVEWLASRTREEFPGTADCETTAIAFGHCYWVEVTKFDPLERNDLLRSTQLSPRSGATLQLGGFRYSPDDPGPGLKVTSAAGGYGAQVKVGDRVTALDGKPIENARAFEKAMAEITEEHPVVVMIERGKERKRVETRVVMPKREPVVTARVQANYRPQDDEVEIVSRQVAALRVTIPREWIPVAVSWNGLRLDQVAEAGCVSLWMEKELLRSGKCQ